MKSEIKKNIKLGVIGLSPGNGHPYSWSAIFNGYRPEYMKDCGFPVIPEYLSRQTFPNDCIKGASVTHIWTQDTNLSNHVAQASNIANVCDKMEDLIGQVDAVLLARDDSQNHYKMAKPFIEAGLPIYIDKPLALTQKEADKIYALEKYEGQIFTCSANAFAPELKKGDIKGIRYIDACVIKDWEKYAIHVIEPTLCLFDYNCEILSCDVNDFNGFRTVILNWDNGLITSFKTLGKCKGVTRITAYTENGPEEIVFHDTFNSFKNALMTFVSIIKGEIRNSSRAITQKAIEIIERGNHA